MDRCEVGDCAHEHRRPERGIAHLTMMPGETRSATTSRQTKTAEAPGPKSGGLFSDFRFESRSSQSELNQPAVRSTPRAGCDANGVNECVSDRRKSPAAVTTAVDSSFQPSTNVVFPEAAVVPPSGVTVAAVVAGSKMKSPTAGVVPKAAPSSTGWFQVMVTVKFVVPPGLDRLSHGVRRRRKPFAGAVAPLGVTAQ